MGFLHSLATAARGEEEAAAGAAPLPLPEEMGVGELKRECAARGVALPTGAVEKADLVRLVSEVRARSSGRPAPD